MAARERRRFRIAVIGPGALGSVFAARLSKVVPTVVIGRRTVAVPQADWVIVLVKAYDTQAAVRTARRMTAAELSLDAPVDRTDKDAATLGERFAGQEGGEIEERTDGKLMREFIDRIFQKYLTPRERKILYLYYGLEEGSEAMTLEKIGALMGVTRERIRQIRERAFEKLRESPDGKALKGFWRAA